MVQQNKVKSLSKEDSITFKDILYLCLSKWYWFIICIILCVGIVTTYIMITPPIYVRSASILIKEDSKGGSLSGGVEQSFADIGLFDVKSNVRNEVITLQSPALMNEVVRRMYLYKDYKIDGKFHKETVYGMTLPINVEILGVTDNRSVSFTVAFSEKDVSSFELSDFEYYMGKIKMENDYTVSGAFYDTLSTPVGKIIVTPNPYFEAKRTGRIYVSYSSIPIAVENYTKRLSVGLNNEKATVIDLSFKDVCPQRGDDFLNMLISVYNENWIKDKNQIALSTSMFINDRLNIIEKELGSVDEDISAYKSEHLIPDVQRASDLYMTKSSETDAKLIALNNQLYMTKYIRSYLIDGANKHKLLPVNSGIESSNIESQISEYNVNLLRRNELVANSSVKNPLVIDMDASLETMHQAIIVSIDNQLKMLNTQIESLQKLERKTTSNIASSPTQAKYLLSVERQQKVKESLYLFLLQKREENELSQAFTAYNTRLIAPPDGSISPFAPKKTNLLLMALILGIIIPVVIIFVRESMNTKVRGRKDLENLTLPFIGEIPQYGRKKHKNLKKKSKNSKMVVVKEGKRDVINEAFRVVRTNLEFMSEKNGKSNVFAITSFNADSGKSFLAVNMAISFAIKGKKILLIDGDMRRYSTSEYVNAPKQGLSNYLRGNIERMEDVIVTSEKYKSLDVLPVGIVPPNPTELLSEDRMRELIEAAREKYDYIFMDCPPVEIVADTSIIGKLVDRTIFVIRTGLMERSMLANLENMYEEKEYKNMSVILNGTTGEGGHYYKYKYGYHYGYGKSYYYAPDKNVGGGKKINGWMSNN